MNVHDIKEVIQFGFLAFGITAVLIHLGLLIINSFFDI